MEQLVKTSIRANFYAIAKGRRKAQFHSVEIEDADGHKYLTAEECKAYAQKGLKLILERGYRTSGETLELACYNARHVPDIDIYILAMHHKQMQIFKLVDIQ